MSDTMEVQVKGLAALAAYAGDLPPRVERNAARAINKAADRGRTLADSTIRSQINFSASYLSPSEKRLYVGRHATVGSLEARITARDEPTSLARFVTKGKVGDKGGVTVQVAKGRSIFLKNAFLMKLKQGDRLDAEHFNIGLAVRLKKGEPFTHKRIQAKIIKGGLALLYGPSVGQALRQLVKRDAFDDIVAEIAADEFDRLMEAGVD